MPRYRRVTATSPGWTRVRRGRGFAYRDAEGSSLSAADVARVRSLAIPPAWRDVWICPHPNGHLQATGVDAAGRRQYLYHPGWRAQRDTAKFDRVVRAAAQLPRARARVADDLARDGLPLERVAAAAVRLLDLGCFRIGNDLYADAHGAFGLTTLERRHLRREGDTLVFRFVGKSGISHTITVQDPEATAVLEAVRRRREPGDRLLAYQTPTGWADLTAPAVNTYLSAIFDGDFTAKDFRTWHATVMAAERLALSDEPGDTVSSRRRAVRAAVVAVADYLGNTPTIAKASYIDPRVLDLYESGTTIRDVARRSYRTVESRRAAVERAVLTMLAADA